MSGPPLSLETLERRIVTFRASTLGELVFLLTLLSCFVLFAFYVWLAVIIPDEMDFAAFVENARAWLDGQPYRRVRDPNMPHVILLFVPFTIAPLRAGVIVWLVGSAAIAYGTWRLIRRELRLRLPPHVAVVALAVFLGAPGTREMVINANMIWVLWLPFTLAWLLYRRGRHFAGGAVLGILVSAKPFLGLWLAYFALRRHWRAFGATLSGLAGALAVGVLLAGVDAWSAWVEVLPRISWHSIPSNTSVAGVLDRLSALSPALWIACCAPFVGLAGHRLLREKPDPDWEWALLLLTALIVGPLGWRYYHCWLIGPVAATFARNPPTLRTLVVLATCLFAPAFISRTSNPAWAVTGGSAVFWTGLVLWAVVAFERAAPPQFGTISR